MEPRILLANFVVTTTSDTPLAPTPAVPNPLTLRQAITAANANPGPDTISFHFPAQVLPGIVDYDREFQVWRLHIDSALPTITDPLSIDGYSQNVITGVPAVNEVQTVTLGGTATGGFFTLTFEAQTTALIPYNATADQVGQALENLSNIGQGNIAVTLGPVDSQLVNITFQKALGGTNVGQITGDASGLTAPPGLIPAVFGSTVTQGVTGDILSEQNTTTVGFTAKVRVILEGSVSDPTAGRLTPAAFPGLTIQTDHSRIRGLSIDGFDRGIVVQGPSAVGNLIQGNFIGKYVLFPNPLFNVGTSALDGIGNAHEGVLITSPTNNTVGGVSPETHNGIAGNGGPGVHIALGAEGNQVVGNLIGVLEQDPTIYYQVGNGAEGVLVESSSNAIGGAVAGATNVISFNNTYGVHIVGPSAVRNRVEANYIGTDINGTFKFGQGNPGNGQDDPTSAGNLRDGVFIDNASDNSIGIPAAGASGGNPGVGNPAGNVIAGNFGAGVRIAGPSAIRNLVQGNVIGADISGKSALPNDQEGVVLLSGGNFVGGTVAGAGNLISGNLRGVLISGRAATGNLVAGNRIGTNATGEYDIGNALEGVRIDGAPRNVIGGSSSPAANLISGNNLGVRIVGAAATGNSVLGNFIGTDATGAFDLGNSQEGVRIEGAPGNTIGGGTTGARNVISANHWGVVITDPTATGDLIQGNFIGTAADGTSLLGNEVDGVLVTNNAARNMIGGLQPALGNTIGGNVRDGVRIETEGSISNAILSNSIFSSGALGIDLVAPNDPPNGVTPNHPAGFAPGPNILLNHPTLSAVTSTSNGVIVSGSYVGKPSTTFTIQIFASLVANPSGSGEGQRYVGTTSVTTDARGTGTFTQEFTTFVPAGLFVTATATDTANNTSEFSPPISEAVGTVQFSMTNYTVSEGAGVATITVTRTGGSGGFATVDYLVSNGTAKLGLLPAPDSNYAVPPGAKGGLTSFTGTLVFDAGQFTKSFDIPLLNDAFPGPTKTVNLALSNATGSATIGNPSTATLFIVDDDLPGAFRFSKANYVVNEADGTATITVVRDSPGIPVTVNYATVGGSAVPGARYLPVSGTLSFGEGVISRTFTVPLIDEPGLQGNQTVILQLSGPTGGATLTTPSTATLTIQDDLRDRTPPTVRSVQLVTSQGGLTTGLVVSFSKPLNPTTAVNLLNYGYSVRTAGVDHVFGTRDDLLIPIISAVYSPASLSVRLTFGRAIHPPTPFLFTINQATSVPGAGVGVADLSGNLLDGDQNGTIGGPYVAVLRASSGGVIASPAKASAPRVARPVQARQRLSVRAVDSLLASGQLSHAVHPPAAPAPRPRVALPRHVIR